MKRITRRQVLAAAAAVASDKTAAARAGAPPLPSTLPNSPLPLLSPEPTDYVIGPTVSTQRTGAEVAVVRGTITIQCAWATSPLNSGTITMRWLLDNQPLSGLITQTAPFTFSYSWNTTGTTDGTHVITLALIDGTVRLYGNLRPMGMPVIVQNSGAINGSQVIAVTPLPVHHPSPGTPDFVTYNGTPDSHNATHVLPSAQTNFIPSLSGSTRGRNASSWWIDIVGEPRYAEYESNPIFATTLTGGVFVNNYNPQSGNTLADAYAPAEKRSTMDGGQCDATIDPYSSFVPAPDGSKWWGCDVAGRVFTVDFDGTVTTIYGRRRDRTKLPYDYRDYSLTEAQYESRGVFQGTKSGFIESGGLGDLCFDPRKSNILYVCNELWNYIVKIDLSVNPPAGTLFAGAAGNPGSEGVHGASGFVDGTAIGQALFNRPASIIMADGTNSHAPIGTMFVADRYNNAIRKITPDGSTVSTLVGKQPVPDESVVVVDRGRYSPSGTTPFANA